MKHLLTLLFFLSWTTMARADCAMSGISVFPNGPTIKQNSIFIFSGYAESQNTILGLNNKYNIYLKSGTKKVKLLVIEICVGQFYLTQAVLKPEKELTSGLDYIICIDGLSQYEHLSRYNSLTRKYEQVGYRVVAGKDTQKPNLTYLPKEIKKTFVQYGCGPSIHVVFSNPAKDLSDIIIKTTVKNLTTKKETIYYLEPEGDEVKVGHNMCSGGFNFDNSENYEVTFSYMDASGNATDWTGGGIKFSKPTKETNYEDE